LDLAEWCLVIAPYYPLHSDDVCAESRCASVDRRIRLRDKRIVCRHHSGSPCMRQADLTTPTIANRNTHVPIGTAGTCTGTRCDSSAPRGFGDPASPVPPASAKHRQCTASRTSRDRGAPWHSSCFVVSAVPSRR